MRYSKHFGKAQKSYKEYDTKNATLLIRGGFIDQTMAGVYTFLPMGLRVLNKIERIVRDEMDKIAQEIYMPSISPMQLWEQTRRVNKIDVLFKVLGANPDSVKRNNAEYILNSTHEELITPIAQKFNVSYKDFPFALYQIQTKFRNEARPKSGLLRGREFRMKDMYSFHTSLEDLKDFYEIAKKSYLKVFERLGLEDITYVSLASGGDFTKEYSHEFQVRCEAGEDTLFLPKNSNIAYNKEVAPSKAVDFEQDTELKNLEKVYGENITGITALTNFLNLPAHKCVKTIIYETSDNYVVAVAVRGDYEVNEIKLTKILNCSWVKLASKETVERVTGATIGYAGLIGLSEDVKVIVDDSLENLVNFECGANENNYHYINVNWGRDLQKPEKFYDVKTAKEGDLDPNTLEEYEIFNASEVGNIFQLNTKFSEDFNYTFTNKNGEQEKVYMGCYGIGTTRLMGVIAEIFSDEKGLKWPKQITPYMIHLLNIGNSEKVIGLANNLYENLVKEGIEVLFDDRTDVSTGEKFSTAELLGCPYIVIVSDNTENTYEVKFRETGETKHLTYSEIKNLTQNQ